MQVVRRRGVVSIALAAAVSVSGCSGSNSGGSHATGPVGIRGIGLPSFSCQAKATGAALRIPAGAVVQVRVCPLPAPPPFNKPDHVISLTSKDSRFGPLLRALALPDDPPSHLPCPALAVLTAPVLATTGSVSLLVHLPVDGCNQPMAAVTSALAGVTSPTALTSSDATM